MAHNYLAVISDDNDPLLVSQAQVDHTTLTIKKPDGSYRWYFLKRPSDDGRYQRSIVRFTRMPDPNDVQNLRERGLNIYTNSLNSPLFKKLRSDGEIGGVGINIKIRDEFYECRYEKCQTPPGSGGRRRYRNTRRNNRKGRRGRSRRTNRR